MTKRKIRESCVLSLILGAFGSTATMADSAKLGHVPVLDGINGGAYQCMEDQMMKQIRGSAAIDTAIAARIDADIRVRRNADGSWSVRASTADAAGAAAAASPTGPAQANAGAGANANGGAARAGAGANARAVGVFGSAATLTTARTNVFSFN